MSTSDPLAVRTPDARFESLADFSYRPHFVDLDGLRMHYVDEGLKDAPVALMIHGMPTWSYLYRSIIPPMIPAGYRCIAPDHIGFARSDKVTDPTWYDIARHTTNLARLIETLDLHDVTIFVQDWGGPTGLAQVATMPDRFSRLVIMNTWLHHDGYEYSPGILNWIRQNDPGGLFRDNVPQRFGWGTLMAVATQRVSPQDGLLPLLQGEAATLSPEAEALRLAYDAPFVGLGDAGVTGPRQFPLSIPVHDHVRGNGQAQARHFAAINATSLPVNFVWGLADDVFTGDWGRRWHSLIPHATWDAFDDAGHFLQDTHGERIARLVLGHADRDSDQSALEAAVSPIAATVTMPRLPWSAAFSGSPRRRASRTVLRSRRHVRNARAHARCHSRPRGGRKPELPAASAEARRTTHARSARNQLLMATAVVTARFRPARLGSRP